MLAISSFVWYNPFINSFIYIPHYVGCNQRSGNMPYKDPEQARAYNREKTRKRREQDPEAAKKYQRDLYQKRKEQGDKGREWGKLEAICPVCETIRQITKNSLYVT